MFIVRTSVRCKDARAVRPAYPARHHISEQGLGLADVPVLGRHGRHPECLAPGASRPVRRRRCRTGPYRIDRGRSHRATLTGRHRTVNESRWRPGLRSSTFIHQQGALAGVQLNHGGRKVSATPPWDGLRYVDPADGGWPTVAPSTIAYDTLPPPRALSLVEIAGVVNQFRQAAFRARLAGFDVLELHAARVLATSIPVAVVEPADRRLRWRLRRPHSATGRGAGRGARTVGRRQPGVRPHLGNGLGGRRLVSRRHGCRIRIPHRRRARRGSGRLFQRRN